MPALPGGDHVEAPLRHPGILGARNHVVGLQAGCSIDCSRLLQKLSRRIEPGHGASTAREAPAKRSGSGSEVEDTLARPADSETGQPLEENVGKSGAISRIVASSFAEIDFHLTQPTGRTFR